MDSLVAVVTVVSSQGNDDHTRQLGPLMHLGFMLYVWAGSRDSFSPYSRISEPVEAFYPG